MPWLVCAIGIQGLLCHGPVRRDGDATGIHIGTGVPDRAHGLEVPGVQIHVRVEGQGAVQVEVILKGRLTDSRDTSLTAEMAVGNPRSLGFGLTDRTTGGPAFRLPDWFATSRSVPGPMGGYTSRSRGSPLCFSRILLLVQTVGHESLSFALLYSPNNDTTGPT